jgi:hypothetical protein
MRNVEPRYPRGLCCHEAGHAVVAHWFKLDVQTVYVTFEEATDWYGRTITSPPDELPLPDQVANRVAGKAAEEFFGCPAHEQAWLGDFGAIASLLDRNGVPPEDLWPRIDEGKARALIILEEYRTQTLKLIDHLVEHGRVDREELLRLIN